MSANLVISPEAAVDMDEAYGWYEGQHFGLGEEFLRSLDACFQTLCRQPEVYAKVRRNYRRVLIRRFPYAVFYEFAEGAVTIYCVFHTARDPEKWRQRLP